MPTFVGKPKAKQPVDLEAERNSAHIAEVYVNRRKVGEYRGETEESARAQANAAKAKYANQGGRVSIVLREAPRAGEGRGKQ